LAKRFATKAFATHSGTLLGRLPAREMMPVPRFSLKSAKLESVKAPLSSTRQPSPGETARASFDALGFLRADLLIGADAGDGVESCS
jgi:hypothetical protein